MRTEQRHEIASSERVVSGPDGDQTLPHETSLAGLVLPGEGIGRRPLADSLPRAYLRSVLRGALMLGLITLGVVAVVWCVFNGHRLGAGAVAAGRLLRILPPPPPTPLGMPIERISADLRRIRAGALARAEGKPVVQRRAILAAYDDALMDACRALGVETYLHALNDDLERESERLRTEVQLERAGIHLG